MFILHEERGIIPSHPLMFSIIDDSIRVENCKFRVGMHSVHSLFYLFVIYILIWLIYNIIINLIDFLIIVSHYHCRVYEGWEMKRSWLMQVEMNNVFTFELCRWLKNWKCGNLLHYKGSIFYVIIPTFIIQGGDFTLWYRRVGESIYETKFSTQSYKTKYVNLYFPFIVRYVCY